MTSLIINMPHLQSSRQRQGAMLLSVLCWAWFLMPLVIVTGWLLGFHVFAHEIVLLGGWKRLLKLGEFATTMIVSLTAIWTVWTIIDMRRTRPRLAPVAPAIDAATALGADPAAVDAMRAARLVTVHFTADGQVNKVVAEVEAATSVKLPPRSLPRRLPRRRRAA